jgi:hypothetical protein
LKMSTGFRGKSRRRPRKSAKWGVKLHRGQRRCRDVSRRRGFVKDNIATIWSITTSQHRPHRRPQCLRGDSSR